MNWELERKSWMEIIKTKSFDFEEMALKLFVFQYQLNKVYRAYVDLLKCDIRTVKEVNKIPFLPIRFFKEFEIKSGQFNAPVTFRSSGTGNLSHSHHPIRDLNWYYWVSSTCFDQAFAPRSYTDFNHLGYLPSYASNPQSSLLSMINFFMKSSGGGFYHEHPDKIQTIISSPSNKIKLIWGVSYALYQWPERQDWKNECIILETGGMKGKEKEVTREELHDKIKLNFGVDLVVSEYGMTELLSQCYSMNDGLFNPSFTTKILTRSIHDPLTIEGKEQTGALNIIDLANLDSCAFIATDDIGKVYESGTFKVTGRLDHSDIRGCNLLI